MNLVGERSYQEIEKVFIIIEKEIYDLLLDGVEVWILVFLLTQEGVDGHPEWVLGVEADGFLLGVPETLTKG